MSAHVMIASSARLATLRPNLTGQPLVKEGWRDDPNLVYVNAAGISQPPPRTYGDGSVNFLTWPATKNVDMTLMKAFYIHEDVRFELRFDTFNLFNWVNFGNAPSGRVNMYTANDFSLRDKVMAPRTMQVSARLAW